MPGPCTVHTCKNKGTLLFPQEENLRTQWVRALRLEVVKKAGWQLKKIAYICSEHFKPTDFITLPLVGGKVTKRLRKKSVPSIFPWTAAPKVTRLPDSALSKNKSITLFGSTQIAMKKHSQATEKGTRKLRIVNIGTSIKKNGRCQCCLKQDTHCTGNVREMLECLNVEVTTDDRVPPLVCSECRNFLLQARKFRDMVTRSQKSLFDALPRLCNSKNVNTKLTTVKVKNDPVVKKEVREEYGMITSTASDILTKMNGFDDQTDDGRMEDDQGYIELTDDTDDEGNDKELTFKELKDKKKKITDAQMKLRLRENLSTILENSTILPFTTSNRNDKFECIYCDEGYSHFSELKNHVGTKHNESFEFKVDSLKVLSFKRDPDLIIRADTTCIRCKLCHEKFATIDNLVQHLIDSHEKTFHNLYRNPPHNVLCFDMSLDSYKCLDCEKGFTNFKGLAMHMNQHYGSYLCPECGSKFLHKRSYKAHMLQKCNRDQPRATCPVCPMTYARKYHLQRHMALKHPGVKL